MAAGTVVVVGLIVAGVVFVGRGSSEGTSSGPRTLVWAALGDSFASGEGAEPAEGWTDSCHRTSTAYPDQATELLRKRGVEVQLTTVACSGATTTALTSSFKGQPPQLDAIVEGTNLVTVTMGGNDAGFVELVAGCILSPRSCPPPDWAQRLSALDVALSALVDAITDNSRLAPGARVMLIGYPQILPGERTCAPFSDVGRAGGRQIVADINAIIASVAARHRDRGVEVLDPNTSKRWEGHEACPTVGEAAYVNPLSFAAGGAPLHPNVSGHAAYAADLVSLITNDR
ncbi:MAG: SGNH/GDSL hydrolase family protein [Acidimicrobiia bacterium]